MQREARKVRRTTNACIPCRQSKIKCSGDDPCANCQRRIVKCRFEDGSKILVSERYLQELRRQAEDQQAQPPNNILSPASQGQTSKAHGSDSVSRHGPASSEYPSSDWPADRRNGAAIAANPLTPQCSSSTTGQATQGNVMRIYTSPFTAPSTTIKNTQANRRTWIWLAPSSTWSFSLRLRLMLANKLRVDASPTSPSGYVAEETYSLEWTPCPGSSPPDIRGLPSIDRALYLFHTVKFHLGQHYRLFDDDALVQRVHEFYYGDAQEMASSYRLWFAQFLMVLAFGNAFLSKPPSPREPPGGKYFARAMALMPDQSKLWKESLLAIEVLAMAGLYLYSIDRREEAHVHVGHALRIAQLEGLHTQLPKEELGANVVSRCRNVWWTVYIMDRHFSSSLGLPMSTADSDITALRNPKSTGSQEDSILCLQTKLWHLLSVILSTVYKSEKTELGAFLTTTRSILHTMAGHAQDIENIISVMFRNSVDTLSKATRHITLLYHQCVIVATRPLLLSVLAERLENLHGGKEDWQNFFDLTTTLITTGIKSADKTLQILAHEDNLLDSFLPFDLEFTYGAALHLIMASTLFPGVADDQPYARQAHTFLDEMISKGNKVAEVRKSELIHLETMCHELATRSEQRGLQTLTLDLQEEQLDGTSGRMRDGLELPMQDLETTIMMMPSLNQDSLPALDQGGLEFLDDMGISSGDFFSIVDQMDDLNTPKSVTLDPHLKSYSEAM